MATTHTTFLSETTYYISPVCNSRTELLDRLAVTLERLGQAALQLKTWPEMREPSLCAEVAKLRSECAAIKSELQAHRASHGC
jgi:hypothetical protein